MLPPPTVPATAAPRRAPRPRRAGAERAVPVLLVLIGAGLLLPWSWSGDASRSYVATVGAGRTLDLLPAAPAVWPALAAAPILLAAGWVMAALTSRRRLAAASAAGVAVVVSMVAVLVVRSPLGPGFGLVVSVAGSGALLALLARVALRSPRVPA